jgi:hypothetical protein
MLLFFFVSKHPQLSPLWSWTPSFICTVLFSAVISLTAQGASSYFNPNATPGSAKSGHALLEASLVLLLVVSICFLGILGEFHRRCSRAKVFVENKRNMDIVLVTLYAAGLLLLVRDIFRTSQIFSPTDSLSWKESLFWGFEVLPLFLCLFLLNVPWPAKLLQQSTI